MGELGGLDEGVRNRGATAVDVARGLNGDHWRDAGGRWRSGEPPLDWRRDEEGRWHPTAVPTQVRVPPSAPGWQPPIGPVPGDGSREIGGKRPPTGPVEVVRSWPVWVKAVMAASALVLGAAVVTAATSGGSAGSGGDQGDAAPASTTAAPATSPSPTEAPSGAGVRPGAVCSPAGIGGVTLDATPLTCATNECDGTPYDQPRWRNAVC